MEYNTLSEIVNKQFRNGAFESNFFEKDDLISDLYLFLAEQDKEFTEAEILEVLKRKYKDYFNIFDIKDERSYDKYERPVEDKSIQTISSNDDFIYEYFEKIIWKDGSKCSKCQSKNVIQIGKSYSCRNCGNKYSFSQGTNLHGSDKVTLKNLLLVYTLMKDGILSLREIQENSNISGSSVQSGYRKSLSTIINEKPLIEELILIPPKLIKKEKFKEYPHQTRTIENAINYFKNNNRGKIIHPCGSGKTYTAVQISKRLNVQRLIVVIPSRILLYQQIEVFKKEFPEHTFYAFGSLFTHELKSNGINVLAGSVIEQQSRIKYISKNKIVVFTTLKSFKEVSEQFPPFDLAIFDEAHRLVGNENKKYLKAIYSSSYKKALFLTATEKIYLKEGVGMDAPEFGETISNLSLKEMIDVKVIVDYKLVHIGFKDQKIRQLIEQNKFFFFNSKLKLPVKSRILISALALIKSIERYPIKKVITYHSTIDEACLFSEIFNNFQKDLNYNTYTIHSEQSEIIYDYNYHNFCNSENAVISSVNCFQEGMDVRDVDAVLYGYPKKSKIDIVQCTGRCIRKYPGKKIGYVIIPSESENYKTLIEILDSLETSDSRISFFKCHPSKSGLRKNIDIFEYENNDLSIFDSKFIYKNIFIKNNRFISYDKAIKFLKDKVKTKEAYLNWGKNNNFPNFLYKDPRCGYKDSWISWSHYLSSENRYIKDRRFYSYMEACKWALSKNIKSRNDYFKINKPLELPINPDIYYKENWISWGDFLQTSFRRGRGLFSYEEAINFLKASNHNIFNRKEWINKVKDIHPKLPKYPESVYKKNWQGWKYFLGLNKQNNETDKE